MRLPLGRVGIGSLGRDGHSVIQWHIFLIQWHTRGPGVNLRTQDLRASTYVEVAGRAGGREATVEDDPVGAAAITLPQQGSRAETMLLAVVAELRRQGNVNRSLRQIAAGIGTSHRMLQYYFGSREHLLSLVMLQLSKEYLARLDPRPPRDRAERIQWTWDMFRDPNNRLQTQLLFVLASSAAEHPDLELPGLRHDLDAFASALETLGRAEGLAPDVAAQEGRYIIASLLGLYLDFFISKDSAAVDESFATLKRWVQQSTDGARETAGAPPAPSRSS